MQITSLRTSETAYYVMIANQQINTISEKLRLLKDNGIEEAVIIWNKENSQLLPQGYGIVNGYYPHFNISIFWGGKITTCDRNVINRTGCLCADVYL